MEARQVMTSPILTISPGASLRQAIEMMLEKRVSGDDLSANFQRAQ
jgi:CBS domain-containing protein